MGKDDLLISDVGVTNVWIARDFKCYEPNTCIIPNGFCSCGYALPASISVSMINNDKKVFAISGDVGFLMNVQEMETARRLHSNIVIIYGRIIHMDSLSGNSKFNLENLLI